MPTMTPWCRGRPTMDGNTAFGASSPANPAFTIPDPLSHTSADTSPSSAIFLSFLRIPSASSSRVVSPRSRVLVADLVPSRRVASRPRPRRDSRRPLASVSRASRGSFVHPDASRPIDRSRIVRESNRDRESFANRSRIESINQRLALKSFAHPSPVRVRRSRRARARDVESSGRHARLGRVASVASPRLASRAPSSVVRRDLAVVAIAINRDVAGAPSRRPGRARRVPAVCTIYKIRNNRAYTRSKTPMYLGVISRSRAPSRAIAIARRRTRDGGRASLYKIRINHVYIIPQTTHISIDQSHAPAPPRPRPIAIARRRTRAARSLVSIKYESITIHYPPNHPYIDQSRDPDPPDRDRAAPARRRRFPRRRRD